MRTFKEFVGRSKILDAAKGVCDTQNVLNCKLFVQLTTGVIKPEILPQVEKPQIGDILSYGTHWAIYLGDNELLEVPEWGGDMTIGKLDVDEDGEERVPPTIYRPPWK